MKITDEYSVLENAGVIVPKFDKAQVSAKTEEKPTWLHFGPGNLFKCMQAKFAQNLINEGLLDTGIIVASNRDKEMLDDLRHNNNRALDVILKADGSFDIELIDSITDVLFISNEELEQVTKVFTAPSLQIVSFTVTEKGYKNYDLDDKNSLMVLTTELLFRRFQAGALPITLASSDNFSHNGDILKASLNEVTDHFNYPAEFKAYLNDDTKVSFPLSMIDRITPAASPVIADKLTELGFEDAKIVTSTTANASSTFVNTEETNYWVVEDKFANGRPPLEKSGIIIASKEKVDEVERMKVCTCLNPLHTSLAVLGCLLGYTKIYEEVKDPDLLNLIKRIGYVEGLPVVTDPGIVNPKQFIDEVIEKRLPNPYIPDQPQRIAMDTSQKVGIRFGETIKLYAADPNLSVTDLKGIAFSIAAWLRYLLAVDDEGNKFERTSDPLLGELDQIIKNIKLGSTDNVNDVLPILENTAIFGSNLVEVGLSDQILEYFEQLISGTGKVREVLHQEFA
jgi:fructuronate reductase